MVVLACENDALPAIDMAAMNRLQIDATVRFQSVRCRGSLNIVWIADCLRRGSTRSSSSAASSATTSSVTSSRARSSRTSASRTCRRRSAA